MLEKLNQFVRDNPEVTKADKIIMIIEEMTSGMSPMIQPIIKANLSSVKSSLINMGDEKIDEMLDNISDVIDAIRWG